MKTISGIIVLVMLLALISGCAHQGSSVQGVQMGVKSYDAHFPDMDANGDGLVSWAEFNNQFTDAEKDVYETLDLNKDGSIDHDEWHESKAAHGAELHNSE